MIRAMTRLYVEDVQGDPNSTDPHVDVIKSRLIEVASDPARSQEERESARRMLAEHYPDQKPHFDIIFKS